MSSSPGPEGGPGASPPREPETPWVETREGALFFLNALLVAPELIVLLPLGVGALLRVLGLVRGPSEFLDTIPRMAEYVLPGVGWILVVPVWVTVKNLRIAKKPLARAFLSIFLLLHLGFLAYTVLRWTGGIA